MSLKSFYSIILIVFFSNVVRAGTIYCEMKNLGVDESLASITLHDVSLEEIEKGIDIDLKSDYAYAIIGIGADSDQIQFDIMMESDSEKLKSVFFHQKNKIATPLRLGHISVSSVFLGLDTIYTYCNWQPN